MRHKIYRWFIYILYPVLDICMTVLSIFISYYIYYFLGLGKQVFYTNGGILSMGIAIGAITTLSLMFTNAYKRDSSILNSEEIKNVIKGICLSFIIILFILTIGKMTPSRMVLIISFITCMTLIIIERTVLYHWITTTGESIGFTRRILIYGAGELGSAVFKAISDSPKLGLSAVGFIDDDPAKQGLIYYPNGYRVSRGIKVLGSFKNLCDITQNCHVDEVLIAISHISEDRLLEILSYLKANRIHTSFVPNLYKAMVHKINIRKIGNIPVISEIPAQNIMYDIFLKRCMDVILAFCLLLVLWPIFLLFGICIKLDSEGPVFFIHNRVGKNGILFPIYKFRTMHVNTSPYGENPLNSNDTRITWFGKYLRKSSFDELPQIINVLKGDMSFVGPRPEMPFVVEGYTCIHRERLSVLPGITGLWQLSGDRNKPIHENIDYDLFYITNISFFLDIAILIETLFFAFRGI